MNVTRENLAFFNALASEARLHIIELLSERSMNLRELADVLELSTAIVSRHVKVLESASIIRCTTVPGSHGLQKLCSLAANGTALNYRRERQLPNVQVHQIPVGSYVEWEARPTCGLSGADNLIGEVDDPRYFAEPTHLQARLVWLGSGHLTYIIPNYMTSRQRLKCIRIQMELCSEAPYYNENWPSDIYFSLNDRCVGYWTCPGDFGDNKGLLTPEWWYSGTQHGMLKTLTVNESGTFIDGSPISGVTVDDLCAEYGKTIRFSIASPADAENAGGFCLFGRGFGNYDQDIIVHLEYRMIDDE